jgi:hypothetical protein
MRSQRRERGSALALILGIFIIGVLVVTFVALNYGHLFTSRKQSQSAVDSAALAVAKTLSDVTVQDPAFGRVGIIDSYSKQNGLARQPVFGINTLLARARLDWLIARELGNTTMTVLAEQDINNARRAANNLRTELSSAVVNHSNFTFVDNDGRRVDLGKSLFAVAKDAFNTSSARIANVGDVADSDITMEIGTMNGQAVSNIPIPQPNSKARADGVSATYRGADGVDRTYYLANKDIPTGNGNIKFAYVADAPELMDRASFSPTTAGSTDMPTVIRLTVREKIRSQAGGREGVQQGTKTEIACAVMGGPRVTPTASIFRMEFPQGLPRNQSITWDTVQDVMNASQISDAGSGASNGNKWNGNGRYFTAVGGPFPGSGNISASNVAGRNADNPSVALSFYVYDWLRNDGLRPNIDGVVNALRANLRTDQVNNLISSNDLLMPSAYATCPDPNKCNVWGCIFNLHPNSDIAMGPGTNDDRSLTTFNAGNRNAFLQQAFTFRMQSSVPQQMAWVTDRTTLAYGMGSAGQITTVDCNPISEELDFRQSIIDSMYRGKDVAQAAYEVGNEAAPEAARLARECDDIRDEMNIYVAEMNDAVANQDTNGYNAAKARYDDAKSRHDAKYAEYLIPATQMNRAVNAYTNGYGLMRTMREVVIQNLLDITSIGCDKIDDNHYVLARNIHFYPPRQHDVGSYKSEIKGPGTPGVTPTSPPVSTNQSVSGNWLSMNGATQFVDTNAVTAAQQNTCSVQQSGLERNFKFISVGDSTSGQEGSGRVILVANHDRVQSPGWHIIPQNQWGTITPEQFAQITGISSTLEGQSQYQALNVYSQTDPQDPRLMVVWSIMAQDNNRSPASSDVHNPDPSTGNQLDCGRRTDNNQACDAEGLRFQVTSPYLYLDHPWPNINPPPPPPQAPAVAPIPSAPAPPNPPRPHH